MSEIKANMAHDLPYLARQKQLILYSLRRALGQWGSAFARIWPMYLGLALLFEVMSQYTSRLVTAAEQSALLEGQLIVLKVNQAGLGLLGTAVSAIIVPIAYLRATQNAPIPLNTFIAHHAWPLTVESLRSIASVLLWSLAFIIPGLVQYIRLQFVPLIVMYNKKYEEGELDALEASRSLTRGYLLGLILIAVILGGSLLVAQTWHQNHSIFAQPILALFSWIVLLALDFLANLVVMTSYEFLLLERSAHLGLGEPTHYIAAGQLQFPLTNHARQNA